MKKLLVAAVFLSSLTSFAISDNASVMINDSISELTNSTETVCRVYTTNNVFGMVVKYSCGRSAKSKKIIIEKEKFRNEKISSEVQAFIIIEEMVKNNFKLVSSKVTSSKYAKDTTETLLFVRQ